MEKNTVSQENNNLKSKMRDMSSEIGEKDREIDSLKGTVKSLEWLNSILEAQSGKPGIAKVDNQGKGDEVKKIQNSKDKVNNNNNQTKKVGKNKNKP